MNRSDMLTPEERELARLIGRPLGDGPSARLDADILAMARAPQQPAAERPVAAPLPSASLSSNRSSWRRRRGLTSSLAVAASLVLVVGLAWQLRPAQPPTPPLHDAASDAYAAADVATPVAAEPEARTQAAPAAAPPAPAEVAMPVSPPAAVHAPMVQAPPAVAKPPPVPPAHPAPAASMRHAETVAAQEAPQSYSAAPAFAPPAPPAPPAPAPVAASANADQTATAQLDAATAALAADATARQFKAAPANVSVEGSVVRRRAVTAAAMPSDIEADAALSRHKWLKRIRERRDAGDLTGARASLQRFAQDYPEARIPQDLRPLLKD